MTERLLVTIHDAIPLAAFGPLDELAQQLRRPGEGEVMMRQAGNPVIGDPPRFELFVSTGDEETT